MRIGYADPPYPGCAHMYRDHPDYDGEVDHGALIDTLLEEYDGWCLHTSSVALPSLLGMFGPEDWEQRDIRIMAWVKPFAAFKPNVPVAYAWEPVIVQAARKPVVTSATVSRDWFSANITMRKGLVGVKPDEVCRWLFGAMGCEPDDDLDDMFPGSHAVTRSWEAWRSQLRIAL